MASDICDYCGHPIINQKNKKIHINIYQEPNIHVFCKKEHKKKWIYKH